MCRHEEPGLCELLGFHITGRLWWHWNNTPRYRAAWCKKAGVDLAEAEAAFPPQSTVKMEKTPESKVVKTVKVITPSKPPPRTEPKKVAVDCEGPGGCLKQLIKQRYGIKTKPGCKCNSHARKMDEMGLEWCENNVDEIVGWLREGAAERIWLRPIVAFFGGAVAARAESLVKEALELAKKKSEGKNNEGAIEEPR